MCNIIANLSSSHHSIGYFLLDFALCFAMCNQLANDSLSHYLFYKIQRTCYCSSSLYPSLQRACQCEPLPYLWPLPPISNEKGVRRRARAFSCAFPHFLSRFSKYFLPRVSTLFNVVHGMVFAPEGRVGWGEVARSSYCCTTTCAVLCYAPPLCIAKTDVPEMVGK